MNACTFQKSFKKTQHVYFVQVGKSLKKTTKILDWILESNLSEEELFRKLSR